MFARESSTFPLTANRLPISHKKGAVIESQFESERKEITKLKGVIPSEEAVFALASGSPRRKELMKLAGLDFRIIPANIDESPNENESPKEYVLRMASEKAKSIEAQANGIDWIIAADTTVADGDKILGKPTDEKEARAMLNALKGKEHQVYTAIAVLHTRDGELMTDLATTDVPMRNYSNEEIDVYVKSGDPMDKAGSYAIQHPEFRPVEKLDGCYANVVGLPLCHLTRTLKKFGIPVEKDIPQACQQSLAYDCPVYESVLEGTP
jgi:MAF protein